MAHDRAVLSQARHASLLTSTLLRTPQSRNTAIASIFSSSFHPSRCQYRYASSNKQTRIMDRMPTQDMRIQAPSVAGMKVEENMDIGVIPMTLIPPTGRNKPRGLGERFSLYRAILIYKFKSVFGLYAYRSLQPDRKKRASWLSPAFKEAVPVAVSLQEKMYTALASGDILTLNKICCRGLSEDLASRIAARPASSVGTVARPARKWSIVKQLSSPKLISDRASQLPIGTSAIRQAVVKLHSRQLLEKMDPRTGTVTDRNEQDVLEYLLIQKVLYTTKTETVEGDWRVWGTVKEVDWEKWKWQVKFPLQAMKAAQGQATMARAST